MTKTRKGFEQSIRTKCTNNKTSAWRPRETHRSRPPTRLARMRRSCGYLVPGWRRPFLPPGVGHLPPSSTCRGQRQNRSGETATKDRSHVLRPSSGEEWRVADVRNLATVATALHGNTTVGVMVGPRPCVADQLQAKAQGTRTGAKFQEWCKNWQAGWEVQDPCKPWENPELGSKEEALPLLQVKVFRKAGADKVSTGVGVDGFRPRGRWISPVNVV